ncbi:serine hydrolase [Niveibacterium sp. SC-1]|uniref:serine hydrolase domain-containing protein n=1 Tax=Niveibacterium sp. SC-1 TaxID=3135646 RepID=UPI00311E29B8
MSETKLFSRGRLLWWAALCLLLCGRPVAAQEDWPPASAVRFGTLGAEQIRRIEADGATAFLVLQEGGLVAEFYFGRGAQFRAEPAQGIASSVTALLLGSAIGEGRIGGLEDRAARYLPALAADARDRITLRHLAENGSGLAWLEARDLPRVLNGGVNMKRYMEGFRLDVEPGSRWRAASGDIFLLGMVIESALGKSLAAYASSRLWQPLGLTAAGRTPAWTMDVEGRNTLAACCLHMRPRDFARLGQLVLQQGRWNGKQLVPQRFIEEASSAQVRFDGVSGATLFDGYGLGLWHFTYAGLPGTAMLGEQGQAVFVVPALSLVIVRLGVRGDAAALAFALQAGVSVAATPQK